MLDLEIVSQGTGTPLGSAYRYKVVRSGWDLNPQDISQLAPVAVRPLLGCQATLHNSDSQSLWGDLAAKGPASLQRVNGSSLLSPTIS